MSDGTYIALEINSREAAEIAGYIDPTIRFKDFETVLKNHFLILGFPEAGRTSLIHPRIFSKHFDQFHDGPEVPLKRFIKKHIPPVDPLRKTQFIQKS